EWNYWYGPHVFGELGTRYFLKDGLGIAAGLHEYYRNSDIYEMANYAQTINVIGCIKTSATNAQFETTGLVLKLYRNEYGQIPLKVEAQRPFDVAAATTADGKYLTVAVVNPMQEDVKFSFDVDLKLASSGERFEIANDDPMAYNDPDSEQKIDIVKSSVDNVAEGTTLAPLSVTLFKIAIEE
ncbi:MAG: alpha-L-arabinofuranosidase C-terminal domain-containing protein, partial [Thermoguttaceae bacterium]|nr:alpha-L-arabinofuranosidase C-terminal domain-containing protein [Thermoguttaceae bacterium]